MKRYKLETVAEPDEKGTWVFGDDVDELEKKVVELKTFFEDLLIHKTRLINKCNDFIVSVDTMQELHDKISGLIK